MSEINTPRTDGEAKQKYDLEGPQFRLFVRACFACQLERELIQAQQTIAQQAEQIRQLREAIKKLGAENHNLECPNCPACRIVEQALSTPAPVAVVPWEVVEKLIEKMQKELTPNPASYANDIIITNVIGELQSYAPKKGNQ